MPFTKNSSNGKKQTAMPGPKSAAYKRIVAARKAAKTAAKRERKSSRKRPRSSATYSSVKSRQLLVERIKREIWSSVPKINEAIINLALAGNYTAAKALFDFAGVYALPEPEEESAKAAPAPVAAAEPAVDDDESDPVGALMRSIGMSPRSAEAEA